MAGKNNNQLTEREEQLLLSFADGEAGWFGRFNARRLLNSNKAAQEFLDTMSVIGEIARNERVGILASDLKPVDLWSRISARIEEEDRAAFYQGKRRLETREGRESVSLFEHARWAFSGGAVAAALTYMMVSLPGAGAPGVVASRTQQGPVQQVAWNSNDAQGQNFEQRRTPRELPSEELMAENIPAAALAAASSSVEVDWMRSDGRVRMVNEPGSPGAIIWIKKRPSVNVAMNRRGGFGTPRELYQERIPQSLTVSTR